MNANDIQLAILGDRMVSHKAEIQALRQTGVIPPEWMAVPADPAAGKWYDRIQKAIEREGFRFSEVKKYDHPEMNGETQYPSVGFDYLHPGGRLVTVRSTLSLSEKRRTALHEYAHVLTHRMNLLPEGNLAEQLFGPANPGDPWVTQLWEMYAEAATWMVTQTLGWPDGEYSPRYLALYAIKLEWLTAHEANINTLANAMLKNLGWEGAQSELPMAA